MLDRLDRWVAAHLSLLALVAIAVFVFFAFQHALPTYLHPDEAQQFLRADAGSLRGAFRASMTQSHPPLYILLLYATIQLSRSQLFLRALSIVGAAGSLWLVFGWLRRSLGDHVALAGLLLMAGSPGLLAVAPQMRQYGVLLFFVAATLYSMERLVRERSVAWTVVYSLCLAGMLSTFYGAAWVALALGLYLPLRFWHERSPREVVLTWAGFQTAAVLGGAWISFGHLGHLMKDINWAARGFLRGSYYLSGSRWMWVRRSTGRVFQYFAHGLPILEHAWLGTVLLLLFVLGLALLLRARDRRHYALLLALPIVCACLGGLAQLLPYGGTRHTVYLLPFVVAGAAVALAKALPRLSLLLALTVLTVPLRLGHARPAISPARVPIANMESALTYIRSDIPSGETIFTDRQSFYLLRYYLVGDGPFQTTKPGHFIESYMAGYRVIAPRGQALWNLKPDSLFRAIAAMATAKGAPPPPPRVWVMSHSIAQRRLLNTVLPPDSIYQRFGAIEILQMPFPRKPEE